MDSRSEDFRNEGMALRTQCDLEAMAHYTPCLEQSHAEVGVAVAAGVVVAADVDAVGAEYAGGRVYLEEDIAVGCSSGRLKPASQKMLAPETQNANFYANLPKMRTHQQKKICHWNTEIQDFLVFPLPLKPSFLFRFVTLFNVFKKTEHNRSSLVKI